MERRRLAIFLLSVVFAGSMSFVGMVDGLDTGLLFLAPALALLLPLMAGRYLGEERIARLATSRPARRWPRPGHLAPRGDRVAVLGSAGLLLARRLAGRAPPATALVAA